MLSISKYLCTPNWHLLLTIGKMSEESFKLLFWRVRGTETIVFGGLSPKLQESHYNSYL